MSLLILLSLIDTAAPTRPFAPAPLPPLLGDIVRGLVIAEVVAVIGCATYTIDRLRYLIPMPAHRLLWAFTAIAVGLAGGAVTNLLTTPPTTGIYVTLIGTTAAVPLAAWAALGARSR